jgi:type IV pilus assembly protein PilB
LHTNSAAGAIPRLIDMGAEPFLISSTLNVIVAQRLVRRLSEEKEEYTLSEKDIANLSSSCNVEKVQDLLQEQKLLKQKQKLQDLSFWRPKATKENPDGYKGRLGIYEVLPVTETIKNLIIQRSSADAIQAQAQKEGMVTMVEDGFVKAAQGITSIEEVLRVISE